MFFPVGAGYASGYFFKHLHEMLRVFIPDLMTDDLDGQIAMLDQKFLGFFNAVLAQEMNKEYRSLF